MKKKNIVQRKKRNYTKKKAISSLMTEARQKTKLATLEIRKAKHLEKIEKLFPNEYDCSKIDWLNTQERQPIICKKHGTFYTLLQNLSKGFGCLACKGKPLQTEKEIEKRKTKRGKGGVMYFSQATEDAIELYNHTENQEERNKIYNEQIDAPLRKLVQNIYNTFKFVYAGDPIKVQEECLHHLVSILSKYHQEQGKAFSYFSISAKHFLIALNNTEYKRGLNHISLNSPQEGHDGDDDKPPIEISITDEKHAPFNPKEFIKDVMVPYFDTNLSKMFPKQKDFIVASAVVEIFRQSDRIDVYNKKALYLMIREISSCRTQQITKVANKMRIYHKRLYDEYINTGRTTANLV